MFSWWRNRRARGGGSGAAIIMLNYVQGPADGISADNAMVRWDGTTGRLVQNSANGPFATDAGLLGVNTAAPTHGVTIGSTQAATALAVYNTSDQVTNYTRVSLKFNAGIAELRTERLGTGLGASLVVANTSGIGVTYGTNGIITTTASIGSSTGASGIGFVFTNSGSTFNASSSTQKGMHYSATVNQTGTAAFDGLEVDVTVSGSGSGGARLLNLKNGGTSQFNVSSAGAVTALGTPTVASATAIPAGGTAGTGYKFSSTANFGVFFGSGAPSLSAAKGSLYLRSDGTTTNDRAYINTDGATAWQPIITAA